jgi:hypothetical protein
MPRTQDDIDIDNLTPIIPVVRDDTWENPYEIVDSPIGRMPRWKAATTLTAKTQHYIQVRNDADEAAARLMETLGRADATIARRGLIKDMCDRMDAFARRLDAIEARHRADDAAKERERIFDEEPLAQPPGTNQPEPAQIKDDEPPLAKGPGELPAPSLAEDALGDLPEELRDLPEPVSEPKGSVLPQPIGLFGN